MRWPIGLQVLVAALAVGSSASGQQVRSNLGTLTCTVADAMAPQKKPDNEQRPVRCSFRPTADGAEQIYAGTIAKVGENSLPAGKLVLIWVVHGPQGAEAASGFLTQSFVGRPAGGGDDRSSAVLAGQRDSNLTLQASTPIGDSVSEAVTILELSLSATAT